MRVHVDETRCQGHSRCMAIAPDLFEVDDYGLSRELNGGVVPDSLDDKARLAVANCPEHAIDIAAD